MAALGFLRGGGNPRREAPTFFSKQLKTRMYSSSMLTARMLPYGLGVSLTETPPSRGQTNTVKTLPSQTSFACRKN